MKNFTQWSYMTIVWKMVIGGIVGRNEASLEKGRLLR